MRRSVTDKVLSMLGMSARARKIVSGEFSTEKAVKEGKAKLVIVAEDASDNTKKLFRNKCEFYEVPCFVYSTKEQLGHSIGNEMRASVAVTQEGLASEIIKRLQESQN
jgi:ribosomal protein L7Ae-like RNA K-turn-binding protein